MQTFHLKKGRWQHGFPHPGEASASGLLAMGGNLEPKTLILAYSQGIFPWFSEEDPLMWWSPSPRLVLFPRDFHLSRRSWRTIHKSNFVVTIDQHFSRVISACAEPTPGRPSTWITPDMLAAYTRLRQLGFAHSVEIWEYDKLVGGVYGIYIGSVFFGESMFHRVDEASRAALMCLVIKLREIGGQLIDCQQTTPHMLRMGAAELSRERFMQLLAQNISNLDPCFWANTPSGPVQDIMRRI